MTVTDWRDAPAETIQPLLLAERARVLDALHWDLAPSLRLVEQARQRGEIPGLLLHDQDGRSCGWAFFLLARGVLQIGGLRAPSAGGLRLLLDGVIASPEAELAQSVSCFLEATTPSLASALARIRFDLQTHQYLEAPLAGWPALSGRPAVRALGEQDAAALVRLMARCYAGDPNARAFAPQGRLEEWAQYVGQLFSSPVLGTWQPSTSFAVDGPDGALLGAVITTEIARGIGHIAQIVVDPPARRRGLARQLLVAAGAAAASQGTRRLTLLVADSNIAARQLYASTGFTPRGHFLHGMRGPVPRRVGGVTIRATGGLRAIA
jgi:ribosomal protein S18 acetylase RimI-like enzyme